MSKHIPLAGLCVALLTGCNSVMPEFMLEGLISSYERDKNFFYAADSSEDLAQKRIELGDIKGAIKAYERAIANYERAESPKAQTVAKTAADLAAKNGKSCEAIEFYDYIKDAKNANKQALKCATASEASGDYHQAAMAYGYIKNDTKADEMYYAFAKSRFKDNDFESLSEGCDYIEDKKLASKCFAEGMNMLNAMPAENKAVMAWKAAVYCKTGDLKKSIETFKNVAQKFNSIPEAQSHLRECFTLAANKKILDARGYFLLGRYSNGEKKLAAYLQACEMSYANGCSNAGYMNEFGYATGLKDMKKALSLYKKACDLGSNPGCLNLASMYIRGLGAQKDIEAAKRAYKSACQRGEAKACQAFNDLESGLDVNLNMLKATEIWGLQEK